MLIHHTSIRAQPLVGGISYSADDALYLSEQLLVAQNECSFMEQPGCLDIVTVTLYIPFSFPFIVKEKIEMIGLLVQELIGENIQEIADALFQFISLPYPIEVSIGFDDVKMGVHRA